MRILGNFVVVFISIMGMILADNDDKYQKFYEDLLELHNQHRLMHGAGQLNMDEKLSAVARRIAENVDMDIDPEVNLDIEDNTYFGPLNTEPNAKIVFHFWYDEGQHFTHIHDDKMRFNTSAFTQIVWKSTKLIGMAVHPGKEQLIVVATYSPRGNTWDDYLTNVVTMKDRMEDPLVSWGSKKQRTC